MFSEKINELIGDTVKVVVSKRLETYNNDTRYRYNIVRCERLSYKEIANELYNSIVSE